MRNLWRLFKYLRRHWQMFSLGILLMVITTIFGSVTIMMIYPVFIQLFEKPAVVVTEANMDHRPVFTQAREAISLSQVSGSILKKENFRRWTKNLQENFQVISQRNRPMKILTALCILFIVLLVFKTVSFFYYHYTFGILEELFSKEMRDELFQKINQHSLPFFDRFRTGDLISRVIADVEQLKHVVVANVAESIYNIAQILVYFTIAMVINFKLTLFVIIVTPPIIFLLDFIAKKLKKYSYRSQVEAAGMVNVLEEAVTSVKVILAFVKQKFITDKFAGETHKFFLSRRKMVKYTQVNRPVSEFVSSALGVIIIWSAGNMITQSKLDLAGFILYFAVLYSTFQPMRTLAGIYNNIQRGLGVAVRYFEIYDLAPEIVSPADSVPFTGLKEAIKFDNVSFSYDGGKEALHGINLTIKRGELIALVGPSGGGKTTITNLLPRFYDPTEGAIIFDRVDLRQLDLNSLREKIGIVTQETVLFHETVFNNIAFGKPDTPPEKVYSAARTANAHDFITKLPQGYDTIIGERGSRLSGGQKQRLAIARAILLDPEIIILDEATSSLDSEAELLIQQAMDNIVKGRTVIVIAHRLSTIRNAHRILVVEKGRIVEEGVHEELMKKGGEYKYLHDLQYGS